MPRQIAVAPGVPEPPDHLDAGALAEWSRIVAELAMIGLITRPDRAALAAYCVAYSRWVTAEQKIAELGTLLMRTAAGSVAQSPYLTISNRAMELMHKFLTEFGMTPVSRTRLSAAARDDQKNPFAALG
jgi:P27 family predicted phage terminase small subunit